MAVQRGDIYLVKLNPVKGREQAGRRLQTPLTSAR